MFLFITQNRKCLTMRSNQAKLGIIRIKNDKSVNCPYRRYRQLNYHTQQIKKYCSDSHNLCFILIEHFYLFLFYYTVTEPIHIHASTRLTFCLLRKKPQMNSGKSSDGLCAKIAILHFTQREKPMIIL